MPMQTLRQVFQRLATSAENGLSTHALEASRAAFGRNDLPPPARQPFWLRFLEQLNEPIIKVLLAAAVLSIVVDLFQPPVSALRSSAGGISLGVITAAIAAAGLCKRGHWVPTLLLLAAALLWLVGTATGRVSVNGLAVIIAVVLASGITFLTEYRSDRALDALNSRASIPHVKVVREGHFQTIALEDVLVGDAVLLERGDEVPADGRLVQAADLYVNQSLMTGESVAARKEVQPPDEQAEGPEQAGCLYRGTHIECGVGRMVVTEVGAATILGQIARQLGTPDNDFGQASGGEESKAATKAASIDQNAETPQARQKRVAQRLSVSRQRTPLQEKLGRLAALISRVGYVAAGAIFLALLVHGFLVDEVRWPRSAGAPLSLNPAPPGAASAFALSPDGQWLASSSVPSTLEGTGVEDSPTRCLITVWDSSSGQQQFTLTESSEAIWKIAFGPDRKYLASAGPTEVRLWDTASRQTVAAFRGEFQSISGLAFSPDGQSLALAAGDRSVHVWDLADRGEHLVLSGFSKAVRFLPNGRIATVSAAGSVRIWDTRTGHELFGLDNPGRPNRSVVISPDGKYIGLARDGEGQLWETTSGRQTLTLAGIDRIAFSPDGAKLAAIHGLQSLAIWDVAGGREILSLAGSGSESSIDASDAVFSQDGKRLAWIVAGRPDQVTIWDALRGQKISTLAMQEIHALGFSKDGQKLAFTTGGASADSHYQLMLWDPGEPLGATLLASAESLLGYLMYTVIVIVVAVPEGLPMSVSVSLALAMRKMTRANCLVRQLAACETIGSTTVICTDKTGTLTQNNMQVMRLAGVGITQDRGHSGWLLPTLTFPESLNRHPFAWIVLNAAVNSTAHLDDKEGLLSAVGNPTEAALLAWLDQVGLDYRTLRRNFAPVHQVHFSPEQKRMTTVVRLGDRLAVLIKGAPEWLLEHSTRFQEGDAIREWTPQARAAVQVQLQEAAGTAARTLAFGYAWLGADMPADWELMQALADDLDRGLIYVGFLAIGDPVRADVKEAIGRCCRAGIDVKMITGDNVHTARAVGAQVGLAEGDTGLLLTSEQFQELTDAQALDCLPRLRILARAQPLDKLRIVQLLQERSEVVAVTGDGTNDAPALKRADVGLAMGRAGTEVARQASTMVLLDDSFSTIVNAVHWGRALYENIQRFLQFQLTINASALALAFLGPFLGIKPPFTILQLLWINIIMDTLASIALCSVPPRPGLMDQLPKRRDDPILTKAMLWNIFVTAGFFVVVMMALLIFMKATPEQALWSGPRSAAFPEFSTRQVSIFFTAYVFFQVWNEINCRSLAPEISGLVGLRHNPVFLAVLAAIVGAQVLIVTFGGAVFQVAPLRILDWLAIAAFTSSVLLFREVMRHLGRAAA